MANPLRTALKKIVAYHGSPHAFDRFSMSRIGTGEGAQAYGHGLYFGGAEPTAESYISNADWRYGRKRAETIYAQLNDIANERNLDNEGWKKLNAQRGFWERVVLGRSPRQIIFDGRLNPDQYGEEELRFMSTLKPDRFTRKGGHLYEVEIDADPERLIDWDAPLSQQPKEALDAAHPDFKKMRDMIANGAEPGRAARDMALNPMYGRLDQGSALYDSLADRVGPAKASATFNEAGVPGIKYFDAGSRDAGDGTRNYVTFNDDIIKILRSYGIPLAAGGAEALRRALAERQGQDG